MYKENAFIFSDKYRFARHIVFWAAHIIIVTFIFRQPQQTFSNQLLVSLAWALLFIAYIYPVLYVFIPRYLLKGRHREFIFIITVWGIGGWFWNYICRAYIIFPFADMIDFKMGAKNPWAPGSFLTMSTMAGFASMIVLFKSWMKKQKEFLLAEKEKANAELQLLKAQIHPHFLFNTLNNIYSFSLENSAKTPDMILKLSSLLSYVLYDCKANEVLLEKEIDTMKNYIDLERERYGNKLEVSINVEGEVKNRYVVPLLLLPFLENAFKHGTSEQLEKPWLSIDISVKQNLLRCKIVNSKNKIVMSSENGIGINNVRKRLTYLYPGNHELKLSDEGNFFVVSLWLYLTNEPATTAAIDTMLVNKKKNFVV